MCIRDRVRVHHGGKPGQDSEARMEAATMEERCLLLHSPWLAQIPPARCGTIHRELGPWHQLAIRKCSTEVNLIKVILQLRPSHPKCVKLTTKISHHNYKSKTKKAFETASIYTLSIRKVCWAWWHTPLIPALQRISEFEVSLLSRLESKQANKNQRLPACLLPGPLQ